MLLYEVQISRIWKKKLKLSDVGHGRKYAYFWKIQKGVPSGIPWASKSKKVKDLDQPKINGTVFKKVGKKVNFRQFLKKRKPLGFRHGSKNAYFWKIQKGHRPKKSLKVAKNPIDIFVQK